MKSIIATVLIFFLLLLHSGGMEANAQNPGTQLANHIANKMKDTLGLTTPKRNHVFAINMFIHNKKMIIRQQTANPDTLRVRLQRIENKRDSMYKTILPPPKFQLYLQKKGNLISSN